jgi:NAD(P)-dependent dehydrogenase (short-subunit alcohol dehydrogenase family)
MSHPMIVIVGAGPGLGLAIGRRFGAGTYDVALIGRRLPELSALGRQLQDAGITTGWTAADITDDDALRRAIDNFGSHTGRIDTLHYNPSALTEKGPLELTPDELLHDVRLGVAGLLIAVQAARPFMSPGGRITATGSRAADHPWTAAASLGVQKAGLRNLVTAIDTALAPEGIRAATITVNGTIGAGTAFEPDRISDAIFEAGRRGDSAWSTEVSYDG